MPDTTTIGSNEYELSRELALTLFRNLGTFWTDAYVGRREIRGLMDGTARGSREPIRDFERLGDWLAVDRLPALACRTWYLLRLEKPERMTARSYDGSPPAAVYDQQDTAVGYPLPSGLVDFALATTSTNLAEMTWWQNQDVWIDRRSSRIIFREDPYPLAYVDGVGRRHIWLYRPKFAAYRVYEHGGYLIGRRELDSPAYATFVAAVVRCLTQGATELNTRKAIAAALEITIAEHAAAVTDVVAGPFGETVVCTEKETLIIPQGAAATVSTGDAIQPGDTVSDQLEFCDHRTGDVCDDIGITHRFSLENRSFWLSFSAETQAVTRPTADSVRFPIGGIPADVDAYWRAVDQSDRLASRITADETVPATLIADLILRYGWVTVKVAAQRLSPRKADRLKLVPKPAAAARRIVFKGPTTSGETLPPTAAITVGVGPETATSAVPPPAVRLPNIELPDGPC